MELEWTPVSEVPIIPKGAHKIFILIALFDKEWLELHPEDPQSSYMITEGFYNGEFNGFYFDKYKNQFKRIDVSGHITHWMYKPKPPKIKEKML